MKKLIISIIAAAVLTPALAFAALATDHPTYTTPATVLYSGFSGSNGGDLYIDGSTLPMCPDSAALPASGDLSIQGFPGCFDGTIAGNYKLVMPTAASCASVSYAACAGSNPGMPGANEIDFIITAGAGPTSTTSTASSLNSPDEIFNFLGIDIIYTIITLIIVSVLFFALKPKR